MENSFAALAFCIIGSFLVMGFAFLFASIRVVREETRLSVYRLGRYIGDKGPGIVLLIPFIDRGVLKEVGNPEKSPSKDETRS